MLETAILVQKTIEKTTGEAVQMPSRLADLQMDSLTTLEVVLDLESAFVGIDIPDKDVPKWQTVGDIVRYIDNKIETPSS